MSVRMRHTRGHTGNRRSHHALSAVNTIKDEKSGALRLPHRVDETTGMYRGKQIFTVKVKKVSVKAKGLTEVVATPHVHEHAHEEHENAEVKSKKAPSGKVPGGALPRKRKASGNQDAE